MTIDERELVSLLEDTFRALTDSIPDAPPTTWERFVESGQDSGLIAPVIGMDGVVLDVGEKTLGYGVTRHTRLASMPHRTGRHRLLVGGAVAASVVLIAVLVPVMSHEGPQAAAAILRTTAIRASEHGVLTPGPGEAIEDTYNIAIDATQNDSSGTQLASATFQGVLEEWTTASGVGHEKITYRAPQFPSQADRQAWVYGEGIPLEGIIPYTTQGPVISMGPAVGAFDVASLPTDPSLLASALAQATTGVKGLDQMQGSDVVFHRVALLLSTPLLGSSPAFVSALYQVLAGLPGIESLGSMTDHSGRSGVGFTETGSPITLIVDTNSGSLLEVLEEPTTTSFSSSDGPASGTETLLWLDPSGEQLVSAATISTVPN
jgi:hypothetical protein